MAQKNKQAPSETRMPTPNRPQVPAPSQPMTPSYQPMPSELPIKPAPQSNPANPAPQRDMRQTEYWVGSNGVVHKAGEGLIGIFLGREAAAGISGAIGQGEDMGIESLNNRGK